MLSQISQIFLKNEDPNLLPQIFLEQINPHNELWRGVFGVQPEIFGNFKVALVKERLERMMQSYTCRAEVRIFWNKIAPSENHKSMWRKTTNEMEE